MLLSVNHTIVPMLIFNYNDSLLKKMTLYVKAIIHNNLSLLEFDSLSTYFVENDSAEQQHTHANNSLDP